MISLLTAAKKGVDIKTIVLFIPFFVFGFGDESLFTFCKARRARRKFNVKKNHETKVTKNPKTKICNEPANVCFETFLIAQLTTPTFVTDFNFELPQAGIRGSMK